MSDYLYSPPAALPPGAEVIAYMRDSGGPNQQESIRQQEKVIQEYCKSYGLVLSRIYSETASGRRTKNRDQFLEMFNSVMTCPADIRPRGLILWAYSRFSRDIVDFNYYLYGLIKTGMAIHSLTEQIPEGIAGQMLLQVKAFTNADFSIQLGKQIKRGIADRVTSGYCNGGTPPKGYRIVREYEGSRRNGSTRIGIKWEIDPVLAPLVRHAWELRAQGKSYKEIAEATEGKLYTSINSWVTHFRNESYIGIGKAGDLRIEDHHEPLITWELWQAVRDIETINKKRFHHRRMKFPSLLAGLSHCIYCGAAMVIHTSKGYRVYTCGKRDRKKGFAECTESRRINAARVEKVILETIYDRVLSPDFARAIMEDAQKQINDSSKLDREIGEANKALIQIDRSINRLVKLQEETGEISEIKNRLVELKRQQAEFNARIRTLKADRSSEVPQLTPEALQLIFDTWSFQIRNAKERGEIVTARKLLYQFVRKIELGYNKAVIHYTHPLNNPVDGDLSLCAHKKNRQKAVLFVKPSKKTYQNISKFYKNSDSAPIPSYNQKSMTTRTNEIWLADLRSTGEPHDEALHDLREIIQKGLPYALSRWLSSDDPLFQPLVEEVTQETLLRVLDQLDTFEGRSLFTTWVHKIAIRIALTELRRKRWRDASLDELTENEDAPPPPGLLADPQASPETSAERKDMITRVRRILEEELTPKQREALVLLGLQDVPMEEAAKRMKTNRNALYKLLHDARLRLKKRLALEELTPQDVLLAFEQK